MNIPATSPSWRDQIQNLKEIISSLQNEQAKKIEAIIIEIAKLELKPNDILVFRVLGQCDKIELEELKNSFEPFLFERNISSIFINERVDLQIIRSSEDSMRNENTNQ